MGRSRVALAGGVAGLTLVLIVVVAAFLWAGLADELPDYGAAPSFLLLDQDGQPFTPRDLQGRVVVADFVFTNCTNICPLISAKMSTLQDVLKAKGWLGQKVLLVSFTVDPERDTPRTLQLYSQRFRADPSGWKFVTGDPAHLREIIIDGFHLGVVKTEGAPALGRDQPGPSIAISHSDRVVLLDQRGHVRAYLSGMELTPEAMLREVGKLVR